MGIKARVSISRGDNGYLSASFWSEPAAPWSFSGSLSTEDPEVVAIFEGIENNEEVEVTFAKVEELAQAPDAGDGTPGEADAAGGGTPAA